jgi:PAS domain S-box-containing protein
LEGGGSHIGPRPSRTVDRRRIVEWNAGEAIDSPAFLSFVQHGLKKMSARQDIERLFLTATARRVLDAVSDGVMVVDTNRHVVFLNRRARQLLDYGEDERLGCRCRDVLNTDDCENNCPLTRLTTRGCRVENYEMVYRGKGDRAIAAASTFDLLTDTNGVVVGAVEVFRDLSELRRLEDEVHGRRGLGQLVGKSHAMRVVYDVIEAVAPTDASVLITGESGTGKKLVARAIHDCSERAAKPLVTVNCTASAEGVLETELFGHVRVASSSASVDRPGQFELAQGGTVLLHEIGALTPRLQEKLLRVLQEGEYEPVGSSRTRKVDVRVLAATSKDLEEAVECETFRRDLFYRLNVVPLYVPPLREHREDIPLLIDHFVRKLNRQMRHKFIDGLAPDAFDLLNDYDFQGNIRQLEKIVEHGFIRCRGKHIRLEHLPQLVTARGATSGASVESDAPAPEAPAGDSLEEIERDFLLRVLEDNEWRLNVVADRLGLSRTTLWRKLKRLGIENRRRSHG